MAEDARNTEPSFRDSALQHLDGLYAYAMTLVRNQAEAEDLAADVRFREKPEGASSNEPGEPPA